MHRSVYNLLLLHWPSSLRFFASEADPTQKKCEEESCVNFDYRFSLCWCVDGVILNKTDLVLKKPLEAPTAEILVKT